MVNAIVRHDVQALIDGWLKAEQEGERFPVPFDLAWSIAGYSRKDSAKRIQREIKMIRSLVAAVLVIGFTPVAGVAQAVPQMRQGSPYAQTRKVLLDTGWQAVYIAPMQRGRKLFGVEKEIVEKLGYGEMVACSGTGAGFCRFEFAAADGRRLVVVTTPSKQGPQLHRWWSERRP